MIFEVEHDGQTKPLEAIDNAEFQAAVRPVRRHIENAVGSDSDFDDLRVVFSVDPEAGLQFAFRGDPMTVNRAVDLVGRSARIHRSDA